jgi:Amt family ammonium transporter
VTPLPARVLPDFTVALCLLFTLLVPFGAAGLAVINAGLGRSRNAAHMMLSSLCVFALAAVVFFVVGFAWEGYAGGPAYEFILQGKPWNWIAAGQFFFRGVALDGSPASLAALLGMMSAGFAAVIPLGSGADRWRLGAACVSTAVFAGWTYPLFAHWVWSGWLAQLGANYGLGQGFIDSGGAAPIQAVGGLTALAVTWVLGPRRGKYTADRMPMAIPGHNAVLVLLGCFLVWLGWIGLDCAGAILFTAAEAGRSVLIVVNATVAAAAALLAAAAITRFRFGKPDASLCANGWVSGLVASSAGCAVMPPAAAMIVGLVAGALVTYTVELLELHLTVDDPGGSISVHLIGGVWGVLAVAWLAKVPAGANESGQWLAQLAGVASLLGFVLPLTYGLTRLLNRFYPMRVAPEGERQGLDLHELGAGAYPDFMSHNDDFLQR